MTRVVIVGGGFAGLYAARSLARAPVQVTLVDRRNFHLFQPLLYQVATAGLSAPAIAAPVRHLFRKQANVTTLLGEVTAIDAAAREARLAEGGSLPYDHLIVAAGATHSYFGHDEWARFAPGLKTLDDAFEIRRRVLLAWSSYVRNSNALADDIERFFQSTRGGVCDAWSLLTDLPVTHVLETRGDHIHPRIVARLRLLAENGSYRLYEVPPDVRRRGIGNRDERCAEGHAAKD